MNIVLYTTSDAALWIEALRLALPEAAIEPWSPDLAAEADYAVVWRPPPGILRSLGRARAVFNLGAGVDAISRPDELPREVPLVRLDDAGMAEQMVEYVGHAALRRYRELDAYADQQREGVWRPRPRLAKHEFAIGILGMGVLGSAVASALLRLGFRVRAWTRSERPGTEVELFCGMEALGGFLAATRLLVCLLPLTRETEGLLDRARLGALPRGAYVVNVARGALLVERDLLALIDEGHLAGATLDVFRDEPLPPESAFWHHPRVVVTPHVSAVTLVQPSADQIAGKIRRLEARLPITGTVDRVRGY